MKDPHEPHVKALERETLLVSVFVSVLSAVICMQIIARIGITPNTSVIGALLAMAIARIPLASMEKFRSLDRQNLVQTMTSAAGFGAANCGLLAVGILFAFGDMKQLIPMLVGSGIATLIGMYFVYRVYDSELFPASGSWPPGVATAQALIAGDEGGRKGRLLFGGILLGAAGAALKIKPFLAAGLPMAGVGIAFIANTFAMVALALGLLVRGYFPQIAAFLGSLGISGLPVDLGKTYIPHGVMIGAGVVSLIQAIVIITRKSGNGAAETMQDTYSVSKDATKKAIGMGFVLFLAGAVALSLISGIWSEMSASTLSLWVTWSTISALVSPILVGLCAMHSGWFPGFAISIIFLSLGLFMGFPPAALALLTGYVASTGPCFADMGYDLKTGWIIRGRGTNPAYELDGRRQQVISELIGGVIAMVVVGLLMDMHFRQNLIPPVSKVFAATIKAGSHPEILRQLLVWSVAGAALQFAGGAKKALGVLFATGLLINNPIYGIGLLVAVAIRLAFEKNHGELLELYGAGFIAGDGIYGFVNALGRSFGWW
jgi:uncharacterized oligopeptide transporter (OPT) family protein